MNYYILKDNKFFEYFKEDFKDFVICNSSTATNPSMLWGRPSKAYARGLIISYTTSKKCIITENKTYCNRDSK